VADAPVADAPVADAAVAEATVADATSPATPAAAEASSEPAAAVDGGDGAPGHPSGDAPVTFEMPATMVPTTMSEAAPVEEPVIEGTPLHDAGPTGPTAA